jgi:hypothetical protein
LETSCHTYADLPKVIDEYNQVWDHLSLKKLTGKWTTPAEAWANWAHWEGQEDLELIYDARE